MTSNFKPRVFITQEVPNIDYAPAVEFGDLVFVTGFHDRLSPHPQSLNNQSVVNRVKSALADFTDHDYLICTGAPAHMAMAGAILGPRLKQILTWDNRMMQYFVVKL